MFVDDQLLLSRKQRPSYLPHVDDIAIAAERLKGVAERTPLLKSLSLSEYYDANILLKREDLQVIRSFKIRGAYNKIVSLSETERSRGVVSASAGNHSQGVAYACAELKTKGTIFMPARTPLQKVKQTQYFGRGWVDIELVGSSFDEAFQAACSFQDNHKCAFVHAFDDPKVIEGQGTIALEILEEATDKIDFLIMPLGGGGLAAGVSSCFCELSPETILIAAEPSGAASMKASFDANKNVTLHNISTFVDGAAVKRVGNKTFEICWHTLDQLVDVDEGKICSTILSLYNEQAIVAEPAGALSIAALDNVKDSIKGKTVVCILSGGNNDIRRTEEIKERSLLYEGRKHYFVINLAQHAGALREFLDNVLGPKDDIVHFEYSKKNNRENGPAVIGIELGDKSDLPHLMARMKSGHIDFQYLNENQALFHYLV